MKTMTLMQHFSELRRRILWTALIFIVFLIVGWYISPFLQKFLTEPLLSVWENGKLIYVGLADGLMIRFSLSLMFALLVIIPVALWHVWAFVAPGLHKNERRIIWPILILSPILFILGAAFSFYILLPFVFKFFMDLNESAPVPAIILPAAKDYLYLAIKMLKVFGIAFQLPLIMILLNRIGILSRKTAVKMRRYIIILIVILAAVLTPPDIVSQILLALPMLILFEIGILFMKRGNE